MPKAAKPLGAWSIIKEYPKVRAWHEARSLRSLLSADNDARKLRLLLERINLDPESVVRIASKDPDRLRELLVRYAARLKKDGKLDSTIVKSLGGLRSYLAYRHVSFDGYPKLDPIQAASLSRERVPTPGELGGVLERLSLRGRVIALLMAHSGVRPGVLGNYSGDRGLTLGDLPDLELGRELKFKELPFAILVPASLSKTRANYTTFGTPQLATVLLSSLAERRERGEKLGPSSPVIAHASSDSLRGVARRDMIASENKFMRTSSLTREIGEALHAAVPEGVTWRAYVLRSYCSTRLLLSPMNRDLRESLLGHDTGISGMYSVRKRWGSELLAEARRQYSEAAPFLETSARTNVDHRTQFFSDLAQVIEKSTGKGADQNLKGDALVKAIMELLAKGAPNSTDGPAAEAKQIPTGKAGEQRVVDAEAVESYLGAGWTFRSPLNGSKAVVEWANRPG